MTGEEVRALYKAGHDAELIESLGRTGFTQVYQSGHGNVYCNTSLHIWTSGGFTQMSPIRFQRLGKCDCAKWRG
jgi:hypothetical protein